MPIFLIITGLYFLIAGVRGDEEQVATLLHGDLTGQGSFVPWVLAILLIGAIGYVDSLKTLSDSFMALVLIVLMLHNGGFFTKFFADFGIGQKPAGLPLVPTAPTVPNLIGGGL